MDDDLAIAPSDLEAERNVVGACLLAGSAFTASSPLVAPDDFYCRPYGWMYAAIGEMATAGHPVNVQTLSRRLAEMRSPDGARSLLDEIGGSALVVAAVEGVLPEECEFWARRVRKKRGERDLLAFSEWVRKQALSSPEDLSRVQAQVEERLAAISARADDRPEVVTAAETQAEIEARIDRYINDPDAITGLPLNWPILDRYLDGLQPGNVTIVYAPSSRYKSFVVANMGWRMARQGIRGLWFTTEMPLAQVQERVVQLEAGLNFKWLRRDHSIGLFRNEIRSAIRTVAGYPIYYCDRSELDIGQVRAETLRQRRWNGIQYVIVDLVDMVASSQYGDNETSNQSVVMRKMKSIAKAANVHIVLVSHVAKGERSLRNKASLDPEEMKGSSSKYQDVDAAISIMPVERDPETGDWRGLDRREIQRVVTEKGILKLLFAITKNRHGELGELPFAVSLHKGGRIAPMVAPTMHQPELDITVCDEVDINAA